MKAKIVIDTNVIVAALKSKNGASNKLLSLLGTQKFNLTVSVPLILEYEEVLKRLFNKLTAQQIDDFLNYICAISEHIKIHYLWRPKLRDPDDEMLLELAVAAKANYIITYNKKDFSVADEFGIKLATPKEFLQLLGEIP